MHGALLSIDFSFDDDVTSTHRACDHNKAVKRENYITIMVCTSTVFSFFFLFRMCRTHTQHLVNEHQQHINEMYASQETKCWHETNIISHICTKFGIWMAKSSHKIVIIIIRLLNLFASFISCRRDEVMVAFSYAFFHLIIFVIFCPHRSRHFSWYFLSIILVRHFLFFAFF